MPDNKVFQMKLNKVYPLLVAKAERKNRTREEVDLLTHALFGYDEKALKDALENDVDYGAFLDGAPGLNPNWKNIKGAVCGVRVQEIEDEKTRKMRCLDKLVDDLAKGKSMEKILSQLA